MFLSHHYFSFFGQFFSCPCVNNVSVLLYLFELTRERFILCHSLLHGAYSTLDCMHVCIYALSFVYNAYTRCFLSLYIQIVLDPMEFCHNTSEGIGEKYVTPVVGGNTVTSLVKEKNGEKMHHL